MAVGLGICLIAAACILRDSEDLASHATRTGSAEAVPDFIRLPFESLPQEIFFSSQDGTLLAGQFDWPLNRPLPPLVFIIHHSGPVDRDSYQYLAARLVPAGYAVLRFDKRGTGKSAGAFGCCEAMDALAAYLAAVSQGGFDEQRVFIVAQSVGTEILADHFVEFSRVHPPAGVVLLSSLLTPANIRSIKAPLHIIISDSEPNLAEIGPQAVEAFRKGYDYDASYYITPHTEHTLFDVSTGPIDWSDPGWPARFSDQAWNSLITWLDKQR